VVVRAAALLAVFGALVAWYSAVDSLPDFALWLDVTAAAVALIPATFALVWLALPWREARWTFAAGAASAVAVFVLDRIGLDAAANFGKLAATTLLAWWFLAYFERLSWVVIVAAIIPVVDSISVWRGPTRHIVEERPEVFGALSYAFPVPDEGSFQLGLPDLLFFALFLGAAARWALRVPLTWLALVASFGVTMWLAIYVDPLDLGGLPALPLLSIGFLVANADLLWTRLRPAPAETESGGDGPSA
jgi:hypothetical protein